MDKTIIVMEGANDQEVAEFAKKLDERDSVVTNNDCKMFKLVDGELFEVVASLAKVERK